MKPAGGDAQVEVPGVPPAGGGRAGVHPGGSSQHPAFVAFPTGLFEETPIDVCY